MNDFKRPMSFEPDPNERFWAKRLLRKLRVYFRAR